MFLYCVFIYQSNTDNLNGDLYTGPEKYWRGGRSTKKVKRIGKRQMQRNNVNSQEVTSTYFRQHLCVCRIRHSATIAWCRRGEQGWGDRVRTVKKGSHSLHSMKKSRLAHGTSNIEVSKDILIGYCTAGYYSSTLSPGSNYGSPGISIWNKHTQKARYTGTLSFLKVKS